jgi:hypothetical protein
MDEKKYAEEILYSKFKELSLEERAQILLRNYYWGDEAKEEVKIIMNTEEGLFSVSQPFIDAWGYLEENKYAELVGGTPKSGPRYRVTLEGLKFMDKAI